MSGVMKVLMCLLAAVSALNLQSPMGTATALALSEQRKGKVTLARGNGNSNGAAPPPATELTPAQDMATGCVAGVTEIALTMPFAYMQFSTQAGFARPAFSSLFTNPGVWWRGFGSLAPGNGLIVLSQFWAEGLLTKQLKQHTAQKELNSAQKIGVAATAGAFSSLFNGPADFVTIYMQKNKMSMPQAFKSISETYGLQRIYRGVSLSMLREGIYMMGYAGFAPQVKKYLKNDMKMSEVPAHLGSSVLCGFGAAFSSQPLDAIIHKIQADAAKTKYPRAIDPWKQTLAEGGITSFWTGFRWRMARNVVGTCVMLTFKELAEKMFLDEGA